MSTKIMDACNKRDECASLKILYVLEYSMPVRKRFINIHTLPFGGTKTYPLVLEVKVEERTRHAKTGVREFGVDGTVRFPPGYPMTNARKSYLIIDDKLVDVAMDLTLPPGGHDRDRPEIFVAMLEGFPPNNRHLLTDQEARVFRGLSRKSMCAMLGMLVDEFPRLGVTGAEVSLVYHGHTRSRSTSLYQQPSVENNANLMAYYARYFGFKRKIGRRLHVNLGTALKTCAANRTSTRGT
jgi:hypothetical protein